MNCKQGDMAMIIKSLAGNEGKVVTCLEFVGGNTPGCNPPKNKDFWRIDIPIRGVDKSGKPADSFVPYARDYCMRPLRPSEEMDEMLRITGLPKKEKERI